MHAEIINMFSTSTLETKITHKGEELRFSISCFGRDTFQQGFELFEHSNLFWATFTEEEQDRLFEIYKNIRLTFDVSLNRSSLVSSLTKLVGELLGLQNFSRALHWVTYTPTLTVPARFEPNYVESYDNQGSRAQTYIRSEYVELVSLALMLRAMVPVWGEYIGQTRKETGTQFKEYYAFHLLNQSECVDLQPMHRLRYYIDSNIGEERFSPTNVIDGISPEDFPLWMQALVVIRRLCVGDIRGMDPKANIVTYIYKFITSRGRNNDSNSDNRVEIKKDENNAVGRDTVSAIERYRIKHSISMGEIVEMEHSLKDMRRIAFRLSSNMTDELFDQGMRSAQMLRNYPLHEPQITMLRWVFKPVISPQGLLYLEKEILTQALGVLEAVLWARGHKVLALAATSYANIAKDEMFVSSDNPRTRVPKEIIAELDALYPHVLVSGGVKTGQKTTNFAVTAIDNLTNNLAMYSWTMTADDAKIQEVFGTLSSRRMSLPSDIKTQIAMLVIELAKRNWN